VEPGEPMNALFEAAQEVGVFMTERE